ncbi:MAG: ATP-binding protein [Candidatus Eremiobacteraeota bacterium]|nr:ATP-binding protein [Candidatus Eremiobacteraeota bacterium]
MEVRRLFLHAMERFSVGGAYLVAKANVSTLAAFAQVRADSDQLFLPLISHEQTIGLIALAVNPADTPPDCVVLRSYADLAGSLLDSARHTDVNERALMQRELLEKIGDHIRATLDRKELLQSVAQEVREAYAAARCIMYARDSNDPDQVVVLALSDDGQIATGLPVSTPISNTYLKQAFSGSAVRRDHVSASGTDATLRELGVGAAMLVPFVQDGRVQNAMALHFAEPHEFTETERATLRAVASQVAPALANVRLYEFERLRRSRAEVLERVLRTLTDTQYIDEVLQLLVVTVSHELRVACAAYVLRGDRLVRAAARTLEPHIAVPHDEAGVEAASSILETSGVIDAASMPAAVRETLFPTGAGLSIALRVDGSPWGLLVFDAAEARDEDTHEFYRSLGVHAELALVNAHAFENQRRLAQERAILAEAARSIMSFQEMGGLVGAMSRLAGSLAHAQSACVLHWTGDEYDVVGSFGAPAQEMLGRIGFNPHERIDVPPGESAELVRRQHAAGAKGTPTTALFALNTNITESGARYVTGILIASRPPEALPFTSNETRLLQELSALLALAMRNLQLYENTTAANRALTESSRFKDDLLAMFAHDFKGPLTVISGYCELLLETAPELREEIQTILDQTKRLERLAADAVILAQSQAGGFSLARETVELGPFVAETIEVHNRGSERISIEYPQEPIKVSLDPIRFRHVLDNLVLNALKYSAHHVEVVIKQVKNRAHIDIVDHGIGIPESELSNVFSRFGRATNARRKGIAGSGIGLYVSYQIVEVHGGTIMVSSVENEGSTFTIVLPIATDSN